VEIDGKCGDVLDVQLLRTTLVEINNWLNIDEPTGRIVVIPNSFIFKSTVFNYSHVHPYIWSRIDVSVTFETPASEAEAVLQKVLEEETRDEFAQAVIGATRMVERYGIAYETYKPKLYSIIGDSGVIFSLLYVSHYRQRTAVRNRINARIVAEFENNKHLEFAYPTQRHIPTTRPGMLHVTMSQESSAKGPI